MQSHGLLTSNLVPARKINQLLLGMLWTAGPAVIYFRAVMWHYAKYDTSGVRLEIMTVYKESK